MDNNLPMAAHIRVGYLKATWGDITLGADSEQPHISGPNAQAVRDLYAGMRALPLYRDLTPAQMLARMVARLRGPTWAIVVSTPEENASHGGE